MKSDHHVIHRPLSESDLGPAGRAVIDAIRQNDRLANLWDALRELRIEDPWLVSGCLTQTVWNLISEQSLDSGIKDYDIFYFSKDLSEAAEERVREKAHKLGERLGISLDVRNQARVHLWVPERFSVPDFAPLAKPWEALHRFLTSSTMIAAQASDCGAIQLYAPLGECGLNEILDGVVRPNPLHPEIVDSKAYDNKTARWRQEWPWLQIHPVKSPQPIANPSLFDSNWES